MKASPYDLNPATGLPAFFTPEYIAFVSAQALLTPDEWKATEGKRWYESQLATASAQIAGEPGSCGLLGGDGFKLGTFRREQAERLIAMDAVELGSYLTGHRISIMDAARIGAPISAEAYDSYYAHRRMSPLPEGYAKVGNHYIRA